jgi:hypothetical protein
MSLDTTQRTTVELWSLAVAGLVAIGVTMVALSWLTVHTEYYSWGAIVIGPALLLITLPLARHVAATEQDPTLVRIVMLALVLKLAAAVIRYLVAFEVYGGSADAAVYIREGGFYAEQIRAGDFAYQRHSGGGDGTHFIRQVTGWVFAVTGITAMGGFLVFAWFGFWGQYLFYRAFRIAVPDGSHRRYAKLVLFLPSLLYWPASIGKEAWMLLTLGLGAYGVARLLTRRPGGYVLLVLGMAGSAIVRPHMTVLLVAGLAVSFLLRRSTRGSILAILAKIVGAIAIVAVMMVAIEAAEDRFGVEDDAGLAGAEQVIDRTAEQTNKGGSEFDARRVESPLDLPMAVFTVLFRPLPHEAHNAQALLSSFEGVFLLALFAMSWSRLRQLPRELWRTPYVAFASAYSMLFVLAFSSFGNFGILARQRSQLLPLVLVLLALPSIKDRVTKHLPAADRQQSRLVPTGATGPDPWPPRS